MINICLACGKELSGPVWGKSICKECIEIKVTSEERDALTKPQNGELFGYKLPPYFISEIISELTDDNKGVKLEVRADVEVFRDDKGELSAQMRSIIRIEDIDIVLQKITNKLKEIINERIENDNEWKDLTMDLYLEGLSERRTQT